MPYFYQAFRVALLKLKLTPEQLYADKTALTNILSYHVGERGIDKQTAARHITYD